MQKEIYIPPNCVPLSESLYDQQIRLGIQGKPGSGKTFSSLTAPNCIVTNFDRGLVTHAHRSDVIEVPFHDPAFVDKILGKTNRSPSIPPNRKEAFTKWLETEGMKLTDSQTLIIDSNKQIEVAYHTQYNLEKVPNNQGVYNKFDEWTFKITYFGYIGTLLKSLKCNVIYLCHELPERDSDGRIMGIKPMLTGQAGDSIAGDFTDWYRAITVSKPVNNEQRERLKKEMGVTDSIIDEWCSFVDKDYSTIHLWQTQSDGLFSAKTSLYKAPRFIPANWGMFSKYKQPKQKKNT